MTDRDEIIEKINLYGLAMDSQRWDLFDRIFTTHVDADYGKASQWKELQQFKADFGAFHAAFDATQHVMTNHLVCVDGDRANSLTYGAWRLIRHAAKGDPLWDGTGWYDDEWVRTHSGWRIARRVCRVVWSTGNEAVKEMMEDVAFENEFVSMREEGRSGRLSYLNAIS